MTTPARKRLMWNFKRLQKNPPVGISGAPQDNNIMHWNAVISGPDDTPWDGGTFKLTLQFTKDYQPEQTPNTLVCFTDVSSKQLCLWKHILGYLTKPMEPHLRRCCNTHINLVFAL